MIRMPNDDHSHPSSSHPERRTLRAGAMNRVAFRMWAARGDDGLACQERVHKA